MEIFLSILIAVCVIGFIGILLLLQDVRNLLVKTNKSEEIKISSPEIRDVSWDGVFKEFDERMSKVKCSTTSEETPNNTNAERVGVTSDELYDFAVTINDIKNSEIQMKDKFQLEES